MNKFFKTKTKQLQNLSLEKKHPPNETSLGDLCGTIWHPVNMCFTNGRQASVSWPQDRFRSGLSKGSPSGQAGGLSLSFHGTLAVITGECSTVGRVPSPTATS